MRNFVSSKLSLGKKVDLLKSNEELWKCDVFMFYIVWMVDTVVMKEKKM